MHVMIREVSADREFVEQSTIGFDPLSDRVQSYTPERVAGLTGIPAEDIVSLAREYATVRPAGIRLNYGVQRSERGGIGRPGDRDASGTHRRIPERLAAACNFPPPRHSISTGRLWSGRSAAKAYPTAQHVPVGRGSERRRRSTRKALVVYNSNPAAIAPNQRRSCRSAREDLFTVVLEQFQTDTADYADIVLPVTTFLEHTDLYLAYGHYYLQMARPALPAPGETKPNVEIFRLLAKATGFTDPCFDDSEDDMIRQALGSGHPFLKGSPWRDWMQNTSSD